MSKASISLLKVIKRELPQSQLRTQPLPSTPSQRTQAWDEHRVNSPGQCLTIHGPVCHGLWRGCLLEGSVAMNTPSSNPTLSWVTLLDIMVPTFLHLHIGVETNIFAWLF